MSDAANKLSKIVEQSMDESGMSEIEKDLRVRLFKLRTALTVAKEALERLVGLCNANVLSPYPNSWDKVTNEAVQNGTAALAKIRKVMP